MSERGRRALAAKGSELGSSLQETSRVSGRSKCRGPGPCPSGLYVAGLCMSTLSAPYLASFHSETVASAIRASGTGGDVVGAGVTGCLAPVRIWL